MTVQTRNGTSDPRVKDVNGAGIAAPHWPTSSQNSSIDTQSPTTESAVFIERPPIKWSTQIWDLGDAKYRLNEPIMIVIEEYPDEDVVAARFPEVEAFGEGQTEPEAILRLKFNILDLFIELSGDAPDSLGELPQSWLRVLNRLIAKV